MNEISALIEILRQILSASSTFLIVGTFGAFFIGFIIGFKANEIISQNTITTSGYSCPRHNYIIDKICNKYGYCLNTNCKYCRDAKCYINKEKVSDCEIITHKLRFGIFCIHK